MPSTLGGAAHRRAAGGPESGRAFEAGRARPSQEDNAAAPARRASGTSTWRPGATRGGTTGQFEQVVNQSLGRPPPPPDLIPKSGEKHVNTA